MAPTKRETITERVIEAVSYHSNVSKDEIDPETTLEELGMDSLDNVELTLQLEEELGSEIPDEVCEKWKSINDIVDYLIIQE